MGRPVSTARPPVAATAAQSPAHRARTRSAAGSARSGRSARGSPSAGLATAYPFPASRARSLSAAGCALAARPVTQTRPGDAFARRSYASRVSSPRAAGCVRWELSARRTRPRVHATASRYRALRLLFLNAAEAVLPGPSVIPTPRPTHRSAIASPSPASRARPRSAAVPAPMGPSASRTPARRPAGALRSRALRAHSLSAAGPVRRATVVIRLLRLPRGLKQQGLEGMEGLGWPDAGARPTRSPARPPRHLPAVENVRLPIPAERPLEAHRVSATRA